MVLQNIMTVARSAPNVLLCHDYGLIVVKILLIQFYYKLTHVAGSYV